MPVSEVAGREVTRRRDVLADEIGLDEVERGGMELHRHGQEHDRVENDRADRPTLECRGRHRSGGEPAPR